MVKVGDFVFAEYDNGEIVNGEVVKVKAFGDRLLVTIKAAQGYRSIYLDKCLEFLTRPFVDQPDQYSLYHRYY